MGLAFTRPEWLPALPLVAAALVYSARGSYAGLTGARRWVAWSVRGALMTALVLALAGAQFVQPTRALTVVFALDGSYSVPESERERALELVRQALSGRAADHRAALVVFGHDAVVESDALRTPAEVAVSSEAEGGYTDLSAGLRLALGLVPPDSAGRVVVISDGNENMGSAAEEVPAARAGGVVVDVVPLGSRAVHDLLVGGVDAPSSARRGEPVPVRVRLQSSRPTQATLTLLVDDEPHETRALTLAAGSTSLDLPVAFDEPGFHRVEVAVHAEGDDCPENDAGTAFVQVRGKPRVLVVDSVPDETGALRRALRLQDIEVRVAGPQALPTDAADLEGWDAVLLSDLPAYKMHERQMLMLRDAVRDRGLGFGMLGGELSFGAGGYYRTPVEEALPVTMDVTKDRVFPAAAVLIVMDTSGSMGMEEDGSTKIELAAEAGAAVVDLLQPYDAVGFIASDPAPTVVCRLRTLEDRVSVKSDIRSVRAGGGGISVYPSLQAAYQVLADSDAPIRHIILLADGSDCDEQEGSVPLVRLMAAERITTTAIAFGDGPHTPFLRDLVAAGGGHYYLTERAGDLRSIFTREALTIAKSVLIEETFAARPADASELTAGLDWSSAPSLLGYVATTPRDRAQTPLVSHKSDPVLAHWHYGLGRSVAFTSDAKAHWAAHWLGWPDFGKFWGQVVRWVLRRPDAGNLHARIEREGDRVRIVVDALADDGAPLNGLEVRAAVNGPNGGRTELVLPQSGPGSYSAEAPAAATGPYVVGVTAQGPEGMAARQTVGFSVDYPPDYADTEPDERLLASLAQQTGGQVLENLTEVFTPPPTAPRRHTDIWRLLLWLAALLLPLDVAVRRLVLRREDLAPFVAVVAALFARLRRRRRLEQPGTVDRLLEVSRTTREREERAVPPDRAPAAPPQAPPPPAAVPPPRSERKPEAAPRRPHDEDESTTARLLRRKRELRDKGDD